MTVPKVSALLCCLAVQAGAQELIRTIELPAHRALMLARETVELRPFETDGCSGGMSSVWGFAADIFPEFARTYEEAPPWEDCCVTHDRAYHDAGGADQAEDSFDARLAADAELRACVLQNGEEQAEQIAERLKSNPERVLLAYDAISEAMYLAVRFGGGPCTGTPWRWGYGYPGCTPFDTLSPARD